MEADVDNSSPLFPYELKNPKPLYVGQVEVIQGETPNDFTRKLIAKFGRRYIDMVKQYGAVEYIVDAELGEVIDILPPDDYLVESDEIAMERFRTGARDSSHYSITAGGLARLAFAEAQFYAVQYEQLRSEPSFLREQVEDSSRHRPELVPDFDGLAPTVDELLAIPRFVAQICRYTIHNLLSHLGIWNLIGKYLMEIQELDETKGRLGALKRRKELMSYVKFMIEGEIASAEQRVQHGIFTRTFTRKIWLREKSHPDYTGAVLSNHPDKTEDFIWYFSQDTVEGAFVRFAAQDLTKKFTKWTSHECRLDLFQRLDDNPSQWQTFDAHFSEQITQLRRLMDFLEMLNHPGVAEIPPDDRYNGFAYALQKSEATFKRTNLEKHIKNIQSLERPAVATKLWRDIDVAFNKAHGLIPEAFVGFEQHAPRWHMALPAPPPQIIPSEPASPGLQQPTSRVERPPTPPPANIKPYSDQEFVSSPLIDDNLDDRKGPKVKSRPATERDLPDAEVDELVDELEGIFCGALGLGIAESELRQPLPIELPVFRVGKRAFEVFERIFAPGERGQLSFTDFQYAMTEIGFSYRPGKGKGSRGVFYPPDFHINVPFFCHIPHGSRSTLDPIRLRQYASNLKRSYGWTIEWFALGLEDLKSAHE